MVKSVQLFSIRPEDHEDVDILEDSYDENKNKKVAYRFQVHAFNSRYLLADYRMGNIRTEI
jgi:hypothetical protein